ncbi:hypothetical protein HMPREF0490_00821 [Lachnospiraceae bacterium 6_1_37FAA]|nr:hypothetical protein HMPREF0490_00821 [Lachnospiraceae bacterium 6_1_37FAA]
MNKFEASLLIGSSILIILYIVGAVLNSIVTSKRNQTYQEYTEIIRKQNLLLKEDINLTNKILKLLSDKICEDKKENDSYKQEEKR